MRTRARRADSRIVGIGAPRAAATLAGPSPRTARRKSVARSASPRRLNSRHTALAAAVEPRSVNSPSEVTALDEPARDFLERCVDALAREASGASPRKYRSPRGARQRHRQRAPRSSPRRGAPSAAATAARLPRRSRPSDTPISRRGDPAAAPASGARAGFRCRGRAPIGKMGFRLPRHASSTTPTTSAARRNRRPTGPARNCGFRTVGASWTGSQKGSGRRTPREEPGAPGVSGWGGPASKRARTLAKALTVSSNVFPQVLHISTTIRRIAPRCRISLRNRLVTPCKATSCARRTDGLLW